MSSEDYQKVIKKTFNDPLTDVLLKNSNITRIQFETLIIDMLTDIISDKKLSFNEKTLYRSKNVSRGSFSRSLSQARKNVISSIFTVVLLSYIGVFNERPFDEYYLLAEKLKEYTAILESSKSIINKSDLKRLETELIDGITQLATPTSIKLLWYHIKSHDVTLKSLDLKLYLHHQKALNDFLKQKILPFQFYL